MCCGAGAQDAQAGIEGGGRRERDSPQASEQQLSQRHAMSDKAAGPSGHAIRYGLTQQCLGLCQKGGPGV
jgi:hypothetical protein